MPKNTPNNNNDRAQKIEKEQIVYLHFLGEEVLSNIPAIERRKRHLEMAMILGNAFRNKVKLEFEAGDGAKQVETTVWATTEQNIVLKGGVTIPIQSIKAVSLH